jgi:RNA polymerase sigma-70 factor (ECF subfamily)
MLRRSKQGSDARPDRGNTDTVLTAAELDAARRGDADAVTHIYRSYSQKLYRFFMSHLGNHHTAQDLTGQVFVSAIQSLPRFRGPSEAFGGWLFRIARNDLLDFRRSQMRRPTEPLDERLADVAQMERSHAPDPEGIALTRMDFGHAMRCLLELSEDQREVLALRFVADMSTVEVAEAVGKTVGAVKALQHRGLASLQRIIAASPNGSRRSRSQQPYPSTPPRRLEGEET